MESKLNTIYYSLLPIIITLITILIVRFFLSSLNKYFIKKSKYTENPIGLSIQ